MKRPGGIAQKDRIVSEVVYFHPDNAVEIIKYLKPHFDYSYGFDTRILDACSGSGILGKAIESVLKEDNPMIEYAEITAGVDVLTIEKKYNIILCNPPWNIKQSLPIYWHLVNNCLEPDGVLLFIINAVFCYQGSDRAAELKYNKWYFLPRWTFKHTGRPLLDCGIMVYHADNYIPLEASKLRPYIPITRRYK